MAAVVLTIGVAGVLSLSTAQPSQSQASYACAAPAAGAPMWVDYADKWVRFRRVFRKAGVVVALAHRETATQMRSAGAVTAYWEMDLKGLVGTPSAPRDAGRMAGAAAHVAAAASSVTGCSTPPVALNELRGAQLRAPWSASNRQYRANVLELARQLSARGVRPYLLLSQNPAANGPAGDWLRAIGQVASIVREVYVPAPDVARGGARYLRFELRRAVRSVTRVGVPSSNVGLALGFQTGIGGRQGLGRRAWFNVVKIEALAARQVALELGVSSIWSWGWATWNGTAADPWKATAACVYLWARDPALCNGPQAAGAGFRASRSGFEPRTLAPGTGARVFVTSPGRRTWLAVRSAPQLTARFAFVQRGSGATWTTVKRIALSPFGAQHVTLAMPHGSSFVRLSVVAEPANGGAGFATSPLRVTVRR